MTKQAEGALSRSYLLPFASDGTLWTIGLEVLTKYRKLSCRSLDMITFYNASRQ